MRRRGRPGPFTTAIAVPLALAMALAACGGDDAGTQETVPTPSLVSTTSLQPPESEATTTPVTGGSAPNTRPVTSTSASTGTPASLPTGDLRRASVKLTKVATMNEPVALAVRPGGDGALYIAERGGRIKRLLDGAVESTPVLDLSKRTRSEGERGLLGLTFSADGSFLYVDYTDRRGDSNVDEYSVTDDGRVDAGSRRQVLFQEQPYANHNGGNIVTGPDGLLYIGFGDGGSGDDPENRAQNLTTMLGKLLRIDPHPSGDAPYTIPPDNPFAGRTDARPEIWAYGLRNPWRFSFDAGTNDLWIADVGQNHLEEIDRIALADGGVNFGWRVFEGREPYLKGTAPGAVPPVYQYEHGKLGCSITGGYVYRGSRIPQLVGSYVYADYCAAGIRAITVDGRGDVTAEAQLDDAVRSIASFGQGPDLELYALSLDGTVYRIDPA